MGPRSTSLAYVSGVWPTPSRCARLAVGAFAKCWAPVVQRAATALAVVLAVVCVPAAAEAQPFAYVRDQGQDVFVVDTATNKVVATVRVGSGSTGVAVSPDGSRAYVANSRWDFNTVSVIDTGTNTVIATVPVGEQPQNLAVSPDGRRVYVTNGLSRTVSVIDTTINAVVATVPVDIGPTGVAVTPDGSRVYVVNGGVGKVSVIDTSTNQVVATLGKLGNALGRVAVSPDGSRVYVTDGGSVISIDTATNSVVATVPVGSQARGIVVSPDGSRAYVANEVSRTVSVIDTATNQVVATVPVVSSPLGIGVSPDGSRVYVTNPDAHTISVIATATNLVIESISFDARLLLGELSIQYSGYTSSSGAAVPATPAWALALLAGVLIGVSTRQYQRARATFRRQAARAAIQSS